MTILLTLELETDAEFLSDQSFSGYVKQKYHTSIIIPAYNEEKRIGPFLNSLISTSEEDTEIIVVFDGNDNTPEILKPFGNRVRLLQFSKRLGKGGAIIEGFKCANGEVVGFVDADGSIEPAEIFRLSTLVTIDTPVVVGSRWVKSSRVIRSEPLFNRVASRIFHYLTLLVLGITTKDTQCGLKFFNRSIVDSILNSITVSDWMIDIALLYHTRLAGKQVKEVGITWSHQGNSKFHILTAIPAMFLTLLGLRLVHSRLLGRRFRSLHRFTETLRQI